MSATKYGSTSELLTSTSAHTCLGIRQPVVHHADPKPWPAQVLQLWITTPNIQLCHYDETQQCKPGMKPIELCDRYARTIPYLSCSHIQWRRKQFESGGHMASMEREPIRRSGGRAPSGVQGQSPWSGGKAPLKLKCVREQTKLSHSQCTWCTKSHCPQSLPSNN